MSLSKIRLESGRPRVGRTRKTTYLTLNYLMRRKEILPQVDGFLLMARDFFRKAEELRFEGGANNYRLSAIAVVHAVEMFLYGLFERREDLGLSAYRKMA